MTSWPNIRYAFRLLAKSPLFTLAAILSLGLGLAGTLTVHTWLYQAVLDPLPGVPGSRDLMVVEGRTPTGRQGISYPDYLDYRAESGAFESVFAGQQVELSLQEGPLPERVWAWHGSACLFETLRVAPALGRLFVPEDDRAGAPLGVVLSHAYWSRRFGRDPQILGRRLRISGRDATVLGVAAEGWMGPVAGISYDLFFPLEPFLARGGDPECNLESRPTSSLYVLGRIKQGLTHASAAARLRAVARDLKQRHPEIHKDLDLAVYRLPESPMGAPVVLARPLALLLGGMSFLLLLGCANVANLLLARAVQRQGELHLRSALGATRGQIMRQLLAESALLGLGAGLTGVLLTRWGLGLLQSAIPPIGIPVVFGIALDGRGILLAMGLSLITTLAFGMLPALRASASPAGLPRRSRSQGRVHSALVVTAMAIATTLLCGAALMGLSAWRIKAGHPGFRPEGLIYGDLGLHLAGYDAGEARRLGLELLDRLRAVPGVESATFSEGMPLGFLGPKGAGGRREDMPPDVNLVFHRNLVGPGFFRTFRIPLLEGRDITDQDRADAPQVMVVNETLARRLFPEGSPLGRRMRVNGAWRVIVGVSRDFKFQGWSDSPAPFVYLPLAQCESSAWNLVVRAPGPRGDILPRLRAAVAGLDTTLPVRWRDLSEVAWEASFLVRILAILLLGLGALATLLASLGLYAVMSHAVARRTSEVGIRLAVGARPATILAMVLRQGMLPAACGAALGLLGGVLLGKQMAPVLFETEATDPWMLAGVAFALLLVALVSCGVPALRAARLDPSRALRQE